MSENQCFKILYYFSKLIGLAPFSMKNNDLHSKVRVSYSRSGNIYNCMLILIGLYLTWYSKEVFSNFDFPNRTDFVITLITSKSIIGGITLISIWIFVGVEQKMVIKIHRILIEIEKISKISNIGVKSQVKSVIAVYFGVNALLWISIMVTDELVFKIFSDFIWIIMNTPCFIGSWLIIQYGFIANLLKKRFHDLNSSFETLANNNVPFNEIKIMNEFLQLKNLYGLFYEIVQEISEFYSFPIFIITTYFCGSIVYTSYYLLQPFVYYTEEYTFLLTCNSIQYLCMELLPIVILTINITSLTNEMELVDTVVYKLMNRSVDCNELLAQIKRFSMTLLTRNNQFTAYNFFPINCTLLHTIVSTTATYLVILFQFQHDSKEDDETNSEELT